LWTHHSLLSSHVWFHQSSKVEEAGIWLVLTPSLLTSSLLCLEFCLGSLPDRCSRTRRHVASCCHTSNDPCSRSKWLDMQSTSRSALYLPITKKETPRKMTPCEQN
jgi:hypothetical protein